MENITAEEYASAAASDARNIARKAESRLDAIERRLDALESRQALGITTERQQWIGALQEALRSGTKTCTLMMPEVRELIRLLRNGS